ncbi:MAG: GNAT family N-acetyltransferase [Erysipelotrichaceae bacterium]|nr:GNAT family N-acetyltransferase [Erysipelotrichaceae bacterium]
MEIRKTRPEDVDAAAAIYDQARAYMKARGVRQWQWGYPVRETVLSDIEDGKGYVVTDSGRVIGVCYITEAPEPTYEVIENGEWLNDDPYVSVHRTAVANDCKGKGAGNLFFEEAERYARRIGYRSLRVDTHPDNLSMQRLIEKNGFTACGTIYIPSEENGPRIAYQKILED